MGAGDGGGGGGAGGSGGTQLAASSMLPFGMPPPEPALPASCHELVEDAVALCCLIQNLGARGTRGHEPFENACATSGGETLDDLLQTAFHVAEAATHCGFALYKCFRTTGWAK